MATPAALPDLLLALYDFLLHRFTLVWIRHSHVIMTVRQICSDTHVVQSWGVLLRTAGRAIREAPHYNTKRPSVTVDIFGSCAVGSGFVTSARKS